MGIPQPIRREAVLAAKYCGVSLIGFAVDLSVLQLMLPWLEPAWARVISLLCAMHVTFVINGLHVFRLLDRRRLPAQWAAYMATNGVGNFCNYWIFVTMVSTHWPVVASPPFAVAVASVCGWAINFVATRGLVFPSRRRVFCRGPSKGPEPKV
jgi:putative flippase GtrA